MFKDNFYMFKKRSSNGNRHYILPVCNMTCLNLCLFLRYPLRRRRLISGRSVESRTPLRIILHLLNFCFLSEIKITKKIDIKKIYCRVQIEPS